MKFVDKYYVNVLVTTQNNEILKNYILKTTR